jgi:hypothetical protein
MNVFGGAVATTFYIRPNKKYSKSMKNMLLLYVFLCY